MFTASYIKIKLKIIRVIYLKKYVNTIYTDNFIKYKIKTYNKFFVRIL